ncbi:hypothetical protein ACFWUQ_26690 [Streptomyces sp. NPDC058662]|uniref:hypothetical protein n=1 Tax=Streptomyces sp. NPDC058662 TaxID=3346583 RepID=UPI00365CFA19
MTACSPYPSCSPCSPCSRAGGRRGARAGAIRAAACAALLAASVAGCRDDPAPAFGYPQLHARLGSLSRALDEGCAGVPAGCAEGLERLGALAERAFAQALDHELLDEGCLAAREEVRRARGVRRAAAEPARAAPRDARPADLERAVAAERLAHRRLLAALERVRTAPPPGEGTQPV